MLEEVLESLAGDGEERKEELGGTDVHGGAAELREVGRVCAREATSPPFYWRRPRCVEATQRDGGVWRARLPGHDTRRREFPRCSTCVPISGGAVSGSATRLGARAGGTARTAWRGRAWRSGRHDVAPWRQPFQLALFESKILQNFE
jgi:hypothetical protein